MTMIRFAKQSSLYVSMSLIQTNTNGSVSTITINTSFPNRLIPNAQLSFPFYLNKNRTIEVQSITIFTDGNITRAQNSGAIFANNTRIFFGK